MLSREGCMFRTFTKFDAEKSDQGVSTPFLGAGL